jgi:5-methylcytosine-specific restriction endonuclease McrA
MNSGDEFVSAAVGFDIQRPELEDGNYDLDNMVANARPVTWSEWVKLPIRPFDDVIHTSKLIIRVPTVIMAQNFNKVIHKRPKVTNYAVLERDKMTCQYTGVKLTRKTATVDHILPKSKGGKDTWENMVAAHIDVNLKKGNKLNHEIGLKLLKAPKAPAPMPVGQAIKEVRHKDWELFMIR